MAVAPKAPNLAGGGFGLACGRNFRWSVRITALATGGKAKRYHQADQAAKNEFALHSGSFNRGFHTLLNGKTLTGIRNSCAHFIRCGAAKAGSRCGRTCHRQQADNIGFDLWFNGL